MYTPPLYRFSGRVALAIDIGLLCLLGVAAISLAATGHTASSAWNWQALGYAFFHTHPSGHGIAPGPLGIGLINTIRLVLWTMLFAGFFGLCFGYLHIAQHRVLRFIGSVCVALTRNMPPLVLVFILHFFLSGLISTSIDWGWVRYVPFAGVVFPLPERMPVFVSAVFALSVYEGAYVGEIIKAGIASVPVTQWEAAASLGFTRFAQLRLVIVPQAVRFMVPPLSGQTASLIKDSAIVSVISVQELTFQGTEYMAATQLTGEIWLGVTLCYLVLCLMVSAVGQYFEKCRKWQ